MPGIAFHRSPAAWNPWMPGPGLRVAGHLNPGFSGFWLFNTSGFVPNLVRPGWGDLRQGATFQPTMRAELPSFTSDHSTSWLDTNLTASQLGIGGNASRTIFVEYFHPDTNDSFALVTCGSNGSNNLMEIAKSGYQNVAVGFYDNDFNAQVIPGYGDSIARVLITYDNAAARLYVEALWRRPDTPTWQASSYSASMNPTHTTDDNTVQLLGQSSFRGMGSVQSNAWVSAVGIAPAAFGSAVRQRILADPFGMLRPGRFMPRAAQVALAQQAAARRPFMCVVS